MNAPGAGHRPRDRPGGWPLPGSVGAGVFVAGRPPTFTPGSAYRCSDSGSDDIAVASMAEAASGERYEDLLRTVVSGRSGCAGPASRRATGCPSPTCTATPVRPPEAPEDVSTLFGASGSRASGGIVSTPGDLGTFIGA